MTVSYYLKGLFVIGLLLFPSALLGQRQVKGRIVDSVTKRPIKGQFFYLLKDHDKWIDVGNTDDNGNFVGKIPLSEEAAGASYQILINLDQYNPVELTVDPDEATVHTLALTRNEAYFPKVKGMTYKGCSSTSFGYYEPKEPRSLADLPEKIRNIVVTHLKNRLGEAFYARLVLTGGQMVDLARLPVVESNAKEYRWTPQSYYLCFSFRDTSLGIARYTAQIVLDAQGKVIEEIELPDVGKDGSKAVLVSKQRASVTAKKMGYSGKNVSVDFEYDKEEDCFVWSFQKDRYRKDHHFSYKKLHVNASNGKVIGESGGGGIWD